MTNGKKAEKTTDACVLSIDAPRDDPCSISAKKGREAGERGVRNATTDGERPNLRTHSGARVEGKETSISEGSVGLNGEPLDT